MKSIPLLLLIGNVTCAWGAGGHLSTETELTAAAARIDQLWLSFREKEIVTLKQREGRVPTTPPHATAQVFLRRACIDLAGRLPTGDEVREFLADTAADKKQRLIDRLVLEPGAAEVRFRRMAEALRVTDTVGTRSQAPFIAWLRAAMAADMPYDQMMSAMLRAEGEVSENPAAGLLQRDRGDILHTATELARTFLGADIHCAQCHDHPFNDYTQRNTYEFANCFAVAPKPAAEAGSAREKPATLIPGATPFGQKWPNKQGLNVTAETAGVPLPPSYLYRDGKPGDVVPPRYLPLDDPPVGDPRSAFASKPTQGTKMRDQVALWFTGPQNSRFAAVGAWRVWSQLFGAPAQMGARREGDAGIEPYHSVIQRRGCDMPVTWNPGSMANAILERGSKTAEALFELGGEFKRCGYRMREFQRILARTDAYQREAVAFGLPYGAELFDAAPSLRRLPPEVIWDAWARWLPDEDSDAKSSAELPQVPAVTHPLRLLGRGTREWSDETMPVISHGLARFIMNSPLIERVAGSKKLAAGARDPSAQVEQLFLDILGRFPVEAEQSAALRHLAAAPQTGAKDIAWALLNTTEFVFVR